jgi:endonuclease III
MAAFSTRPGFPIDAVLDAVAHRVRDEPLPSMFELARLGYDSLFEQAIGCILSVRTLEETSLPASLRLFAIARTPESMAALPVARIDEAIADVTFHEQKAPRIRGIAQIAVERHDGQLPCDREVLLGLPGIGPKCAALALGIACGMPAIPVDIHVHRVVNRWGYVSASTPERTMAALETVLPKERWLEINRLLVPFGKRICTGTRPWCSRCPVAKACARIGVTEHR